MKAKPILLAVLMGFVGVMLISPPINHELLSGQSGGLEVSRFLSSPRRDRKRLAIVRPFGLKDVDALLESFNLWDVHWPCFGGSNENYDVDLVIHFSRNFDAVTYPGVCDAKDKIKIKFRQSEGWNNCIDGIYFMEANIAPDRDRYEQTDETTDSLWVNGPNEHFRQILHYLMDSKGLKGKAETDNNYYEMAFLMEPDAVPRKSGWLDKLVGEFDDKGPFAILGSKYKGFSWDNFKDAIPRALLEHINGNAVYNLTHPLMRAILDELESEKETYFNSIPYDYRISQMLHEASTGTWPDFPFPKMRDKDGNSPIILPHKTNKFLTWRGMWGSDEPAKESGVIGNFAASNYLPEHLGDETIIHGKNIFKQWDSKSHKITLVISDWHDGLSRSLTTHLGKSDHPYSEIIVMQPKPGSKHNGIKATRRIMEMIANLTTAVPVRHIHRTLPDYMDVCDAPINTEWFMITNAYHHIDTDVKLMSTNDHPPRPVIPYTPGETDYCFRYASCRETLRLARDIHPSLDKVIMDMDMLYHVPSRDSFCASWQEKYGYMGEILAAREDGMRGYLTRSTPLGPTATSYIAFLTQAGISDSVYTFSNRVLHGSKSSFVKVQNEAEIQRYTALLEKYNITGSADKLSILAPDSEKEKNDFHRILWRQSQIKPGGDQICANLGEMAEACVQNPGKRRGRRKRSAKCCFGLVCAVDGSDQCIQNTFNYGGGIGVTEMTISDPGLLVGG